MNILTTLLQVLKRNYRFSLQTVKSKIKVFGALQSWLNFYASYPHLEKWYLESFWIAEELNLLATLVLLLASNYLVNHKGNIYRPL